MRLIDQIAAEKTALQAMRIVHEFADPGLIAVLLQLQAIREELQRAAQSTLPETIDDSKAIPDNL